MNVKNKITNIQEFEEYRNKYIIVNPHTLFTQYLTVLYPNLILRNNGLSDKLESISNKSDINSYNIINNRNLKDKNIEKKTFMEYMGIQDLISQRIFKYIDKNNKSKLTKNEFILGIYQLFYGNFNELAKLSFSICDFNEDGKIYKSDMKLILAYIPKPLNSNMSNYCQQDYIKKINNIIDEFFKEIKQKKHEEIIEINYELYFDKLNESVQKKKMNGAFFFFINLLKYIFLNKPFNKESILAIKYIKDKYLLKTPILRGLTTVIKNFIPIILQTAKKHKSEDLLEGEGNEKDNNDFIPVSLLKKNDKKFTEYKLPNKNFNLEKINRSNLFSNKKITSTMEEYQLQKALEIKKYESNNNIRSDIALKLNSSNNGNNNLRYHFEKIEKKKVFNRNASIGRLTNGKNISLKSGAKIHLKSKDTIMRDSLMRNSVKIPESAINKSQFDSKNTILPYLSSSMNSVIHQISNKKLDMKVKPFLRLKGKVASQPDIFDKSNGFKKNREEKLSELINEIEISNNNPLNPDLEYGAYLYKYSEEENDMFKKYYAVISQKEILFYSSNLKNELCAIWYVNNAVISIPSKIAINKIIYYPIKIIYKNNIMNLLFFDDKDIQIEFGNNLKISINNINFEDRYEIKEELGQGHFAVVKKCIDKESGKEYAVKIIDKLKMEQKDIELIMQEKNYMKIIKHPNIVSLIEDFENEKYIYLVMQYFKGGDLFSYIYEYYKNKKMISEKNISRIIKIIAQCIQYLNNFGIVHRDLKPENIVFGENENISTLTLIDLGVAITLPEGQTSTTHIGTLEYSSPEVLTGKPYGKEIDVWSIGIILYTLFTLGSVFPFDCDSKDKKERDETIGKKIVFLQQEYPKEFFGNKSKYLINLIDRALEKSPEKRIKIDDFLNNFWLVNNAK
jgi:tRNA A-37 threonylcarbamoyl transferase component Bud32